MCKTIAFLLGYSDPVLILALFYKVCYDRHMKYYNQEQIKELIPDKLAKDFNKFMYGQTMGMVHCWNCKDGKDELTGFNKCTICHGKGWLPALYKHDVDIFLMRNNIEPVEGFELC